MLKQIFYKEFVAGRTKFDFIFLICGLLLQIVVYIITNDTLLSFISGLTGVFSVVLCSQKKISQFLFGFAQLFTFVILAYQEKFYGKLIENAFYFVTMIIGIIYWFKNMNSEIQEVKTKTLTLKQLLFLLCSCIILTIGFGEILTLTNDTQPFIDSLTTIPAFIAQILLLLRYKEQWLFWLFVDICCIYLWFIAGNYCMAAQYIFWTANCFYGYVNWKKQ